MKKKKEEEVKAIKILGLYLYSRKRFSETRIQIPNGSSAIANPSICLFGQENVMPKGINSIFNGSKWGEIVTEIITWSLYNLAVAGKINITFFKDEQTYLHILKFDHESVGFESISDNPSEDAFENVILNQIKTNRPKGKAQLDAKQFLSDLIDTCIGKGEINYPAKHFLGTILNKNSKQFNWFDMENKYAILGLVKNYDIKIDENKKQELLSQHASITKEFNKNLKNSNSLNFFQEEMTQLIFNDFLARTPSSDSDAGE